MNTDIFDATTEEIDIFALDLDQAVEPAPEPEIESLWLKKWGSLLGGK